MTGELKRRWLGAVAAEGRGEEEPAGGAAAALKEPPWSWRWESSLKDELQKLQKKRRRRKRT